MERYSIGAYVEDFLAHGSECAYVQRRGPGGGIATTGIATTVAAYRLVAWSGNWKAVSGFKFLVSSRL